MNGDHPPRHRPRPLTTLSVGIALTLMACGSDGDRTSDASTPPGPGTTTITLVTYDSFPHADTALNAAIAEFSTDTGIGVKLLDAGDTGTMLAKAALTAGNPEGDVMWGIDNTYVSRAIRDGIFDPYVAPALSDGSVDVDDDILALVPGGEATPVDFGDVCVNVDLEWFSTHELDPPASLSELAEPAYADLLVVTNPATSSPGLAFLLATIDARGDTWTEYWSALADNGVRVVDSWSQAYYEEFTLAGGTRPLVVSYGSSPPAEVIFADPPRDDAPTGVIEDTCFRQVEFAGVLAGTDHPDEARRLIDFLISERFQRELPLTLFVYPIDRNVTLPDAFIEHAVVPVDPRSIDPAEIDANRAAWIDTWTDLVLG